MFKFERLDVWRFSLSLELYRKIAASTRQLQRRDQLFLTDQIKRRAGSGK